MLLPLISKSCYRSANTAFFVYFDVLLQGEHILLLMEKSWTAGAESFCVREMEGSCSMCQTGGQMGHSGQEKVLGTECRMILDKRHDGWLNN